ncbi:xanthine dehydrogenase family protein molybdopterin-binding subunit [Lutimonas zeaxanthinifaciens]|uniref:xanthine dehydrogenase family protein molybdopterin-binding subunit n=1 Tax=Lutimonas zeaxanthinifaciens TaxID=3060215 RepID=UPI00265CAFAA|nr:molybdopterin cofactor-binding domain-containing protein [Lutimonas sp. YSD2104]WKK64639.1 molybdopterin-dependent oxidoreductase [Lutimonas sp. YSD2104]
MNNLSKTNRRVFIKNLSLLSGGILLACELNSSKDANFNASDKDRFSPNLFVELRKDGSLLLTASRSEMGQGVRTSLTSVIADEMDADWSRVSVVQAPGDDAYGNQNTDGSRSIRTIYEPMRRMGAMAKAMLVSAAAEKWGISEDLCKTELHYVLRSDSNEKLFYGDLVEDAGKFPLPESPSLKSPDEFIYIGKDLASVDVDDFVNGRSKYGLDVKVDQMIYANISRCPVTFGKALSYDGSEAMKIKGVIDVKEIERIEKPFGALGGIAVLADNSWAALKGKEALTIDWDLGENENYSTKEFMDHLTQNVENRAKLIREKGNVNGSLKDADKVVEATYKLPHLVHAPMETPNATAHVQEGFCEVWAPVQAPQLTRQEISDFLGLEIEQVKVNVTFLGGGFGRKSKPDFVLEAVALSKMTGRPVQVLWTREDDIRHSYYHAISAQHLKASLKGSKVTSWLHRTAFPSIASTFAEGVSHAAGFEFQQGMTNMPYDIENIKFENGEAYAHLRIGWLRSVINIIHGFSVNVFADELAGASQKDALEFRLDLIGSDRIYPSNNEYQLNTKRLKNVLSKAAENAGWGRKLPAGHGLGLAVHYSFYSYVASVIEVSVIKDKLKVHDVFTVVDCGTVVNKNTVKAQLEGAAIFGMSLTYYGDISTVQGRVEQSNYHDYRMLRIHEAPNVHVEIVESSEAPTGIGEPGVPVIAPAIINAIFNATGKRYRNLPLSNEGLV